MLDRLVSTHLQKSFIVQATRKTRKKQKLKTELRGIKIRQKAKDQTEEFYLWVDPTLLVYVVALHC